MLQSPHSVPFIQLRNAAAFILFVLTIGAPVAQADFTFTHSGDLTAVFDTNDPFGFEQDTLGLDGASFVFTATFPNSPYFDDGEIIGPSLHSTSASLAISGASVSSTNGIFSYANGPLRLSGDSGYFVNSSLSTAQDSGEATWNIGGETVFIHVSGYTGGDALGTINGLPTLANFPTTNDDPHFSTGEILNGYFFTNSSISTTITSVPEPSAFLCVGLIALGYARRKRNRIR